MNGINTAAAGPPTASPALQAEQRGAVPASKPTTPFKALLATLGSTGTARADVATSSSYGDASMPPSPHTPGGGRRRHDENAITPIFAFGVPVTIAAIPVAGLTMGNAAQSPSQLTSDIASVATTTDGLAMPASALENAANQPTQLTSAVATLASVTAGFTMPANLPATSDQHADTAVSTATVAMGAKASDTSTSMTPDTNAAVSATTMAGAAKISARSIGMTPDVVTTTLTPPALAISGSAAELSTTQGLRNQSAITNSPGTGTPVATNAPMTTLTSSQVADSNIGLMATTNVSAAAGVNAAAAPVKSARHLASTSLPTGGVTVNAGVVSTSGTADTPATASPSHPAVTGAAQQLAAQASLLHNGQAAEMRMRLRPPDLGDVRVILRRDATGALSAHLIPAMREAGDVLNANLHHLRDALDQHSQGQRAAVSVGQHDVANQRQQQHMNGGRSSHEDETSAANPATPQAQSDQSPAQRVSRAAATHATVDYDA